MSEEAVVLESACDEATQKAAEAQGWIPPSRYKGDPERFTDADEFIRRGEELAPILKKQLASTRGELTALHTRQQATEAALAKAQETIANMQEEHTVATQKAVEKAVQGLKAQLAAASEAGDHAAVAELTEQIVDAKAALEAAPAEKKEVARQAPPPLDPAIQTAFNEWRADNPLFDKDPDFKELVFSIGSRLRREGDTTLGRAFFDKCGEIAKAKFKADEPPPGKVEGGRQEGGSGGAPRAKTYASLPAEAKAACNAEAREKVGKGKRYETLGAWQNRYAEIYFRDES